MLRKVSKKAMLEGLSVFGMGDSFDRVSGVVTFRFETGLERDGVSSPLVAALYLRAFAALPTTLLKIIGGSIPSIDIVSDEDIDELSAEGRVVQPEGHRDAFFDSGSQRIVIQPPETIGEEDAPEILLHELGHFFSDARSGSESEAFYEAWDAGERASAHPSCEEDQDENWAEAFRVFYGAEGPSALPKGLRDAMEAFDLRARTQKPRDFASGMELE